MIAHASFSKSANIVTDSNTGLQWQDNEIGSTMTWQSAIDHCEALSLDSYSDWRLPNVNELKTIVDRSKYSPAMVSGFSNVSSGGYWSSSTYKNDSSFAWIVFFRNGGVGSRSKSSSDGVRCVRAGE
jgi:hypothetical protein